MKRRVLKKEQALLLKIVIYLKLQYLNLIYRIDLAADIKLTMGQAAMHKWLQMRERGYPDIFIAEPRNGYHGLYIELKINKEQVYRQDGTYRKTRNKKTGKCHIQEQHEMHERLRKKRYYVVWGFGFDDTKKKIDLYLRGK